MTGLQIFILICVINAVFAATTQCVTIWYFNHHFDTLAKLAKFGSDKTPSMARLYLNMFFAWPLILLFLYIIHYHPDNVFDNDHEAARKQFDEKFEEWKEDNDEDK